MYQFPIAMATFPVQMLTLHTWGSDIPHRPVPPLMNGHAPHPTELYLYPAVFPPASPSLGSRFWTRFLSRTLGLKALCQASLLMLLGFPHFIPCPSPTLSLGCPLHPPKLSICTGQCKHTFPSLCLGSDTRLWEILLPAFHSDAPFVSTT